MTDTFENRDSGRRWFSKNEFSDNRSGNNTSRLQSKTENKGALTAPMPNNTSLKLSSLKRSLTINMQSMIQKKKKMKFNQITHSKEDIVNENEEFPFMDNLEFLNKEESCQIHNQEELKFYCHLHDQGLCDFCYKAKTPDCKIDFLKSGLFAIKTSLEYYDMLIRQKKRNLLKTFYYCKDRLHDIGNQELEIQKNVSEEADKLIATIINRKQDLLKKVQTYFLQFSEDIKKIMNNCMSEIEAMEQFKNDVRKFIIKIENSKFLYLKKNYDKIIQLRYATSIHCKLQEMQYNSPEIAIIINHKKIENNLEKHFKIQRRRNSQVNEEIKIYNTFHSYVPPVIYCFEYNSNKIQKFDINTKKWFEPTLITGNYTIPLYCKFAFLPDRRVIQSGGLRYTSNFGAQFLKEAYFYNNNQITRLRDMFISRYDHSFTYMNTKAYAIGGINGEIGGAIRECEQYNFTLSKWQNIAKLNINRAKSSSCTFNLDYVYLFGGFNYQPLDSIERYNVEKNIWTLLYLKLPIKMQSCLSTQIGKNMILLAGGTKNLESFVLDIKKLTWSLTHSMPNTGKILQQPVIHNRQLFVLTNVNDEKIVQMFDFLSNQWISIPMELTNQEDNECFALTITSMSLSRQNSYNRSNTHQKQPSSEVVKHDCIIF